MSTYYYFRCSRCEEIGGRFSRQAGGWGNFDIIDTIKFLAAHTKCGYLTICETDGGAYGPKVHDANFIAQARQDVPALLAELKLYKRALELAAERLYTETIGAAPKPLRDVDYEAAVTYEKPQYWLEQAQKELSNEV